jgi:hypothetical protein
VRFRRLASPRYQLKWFHNVFVGLILKFVFVSFLGHAQRIGCSDALGFVIVIIHILSLFIISLNIIGLY